MIATIKLTYYKKSKSRPVNSWDVVFKWFRNDGSFVGKTGINLKTEDLKNLQAVLNEKFN